MSAGLLCLFLVAQSDAAPTILLRWEAIEGVDRYLLELAEDRNFEHIVLSEEVADTFYRFKKRENKEYYWRVKSIDHKGRPGLFSAARAVGAVISAPRVERPKAGAVVPLGAELPSLVFAWEGLKMASAYELQIARDDRWQHVLATLTGTATSQSWVPPGPGTFYWRVRGRDATGGEYSATRRLDVVLDAPKPCAAQVEPSRPRCRASDPDISIGEQPVPVTLFADSIATASGYEWQLSEGGQQKLTKQSKEPRCALSWSEAGRVSWRVRALSNEVAPSKWSTARAIVFATPDRPAPASAPASAEVLPASAPVEVAITPIETPSAPTPPPRFGVRLGAGVGVATNFSAFVGPSVAIDAGYALPVLAGRLSVTLRVSYRYARIAASEPFAVSGVEHVVPIALGLRYEHPVGPVFLYVGVGALLGVFSGHLSSPALEQLAASGVGFGVDGVVGVGLPIVVTDSVTHSLFLDLRYAWLRQGNVIFHFDGGGFEPVVGYRMSL